MSISVSRFFLLAAREVRHTLFPRPLSKHCILQPRDIEQLQSYVRVRGGLPMLRKKLESHTCRIAYFGTSVTAQRHGFRPYLHRKIERFSGQKHTQIRAGFGGFDAINASYFFHDRVLSRGPDLCFLDFSIAEFQVSSVGRYGEVIEMIVRSLLDRNCSVCFLHMLHTCPSERTPFWEALCGEYERIADHYNIPSIDIAGYLQSFFASGRVGVEEIFRDIVHVRDDNRAGDFLAEIIFQGFLHLLRDELAQQLPPLQRTSLYQIEKREPIFLRMREEFLVNKSLYKKKKFWSYTYYEIGADNEICFRCPGECEGILCVAGEDSGFIAVQHGDDVSEYSVWDQWCHYDRVRARMIVPIPSYSSEPIRLRLTDKAIDYSQCRRKLRCTHRLHKKLKIIGFLCRAAPYKGCAILLLGCFLFGC